MYAISQVKTLNLTLMLEKLILPLMLSGALLLPTWRLSAQTQEIEKQTQENYKALRKQQTAENKQPDHETRTDNEVRKEDIPSNGRAILSYDPITDGDLRWFGPSNVGTTPEDETKEATAPPLYRYYAF